MRHRACHSSRLQWRSTVKTGTTLQFGGDEGRIEPQTVEIVGVLVIAGNRRDASVQDVGQRTNHTCRIALIGNDCR